MLEIILCNYASVPGNGAKNLLGLFQSLYLIKLQVHGEPLAALEGRSQKGDG
jgi:hypothetical protein